MKFTSKNYLKWYIIHSREHPLSFTSIPLETPPVPQKNNFYNFYIIQIKLASHWGWIFACSWSCKTEEKLWIKFVHENFDPHEILDLHQIFDLRQPTVNFVSRPTHSKLRPKIYWPTPKFNKPSHSTHATPTWFRLLTHLCTHVATRPT